MTIKLYNTLTRSKDEFKPIDENNVRIYACGPTVYNFVHIGNGRMNVVFDVLYRLLKYYYPKVTYASNITDIDDKIMDTAKAKGISTKELSEHYAAEFFADIKNIGCLMPDYTPKATEYIAQQIAMIEKLIANGHAYEAEGHVLFDVPSYPEYGCLSKRSQDELIAGARIEVAPYKKSPSDFILWKPSTDDQPGWDSPWGYGRPGWHLECSVMSTDLFGENFDIHGGGQDLTFPHHENEIAQSCCANKGSTFANYSIHNGFLQANGEKMSKSLGNFYTVRELLEKYDGEVIRLVLLSAQYRQPLDFTMNQLDEAKRTLDKWYGALDKIGITAGKEIHNDTFISALSDDLNTPAAFAELHRLFGEVNKTSGVKQEKAVCEFLTAANMIGLLSKKPEEWLRGAGGSDNGLSPDFIEELIVERAEAKKNKNYARADEIRNELTDKGIILEDSPTGTTWKRG